jgi:hypothetical protein
MPSRDFQDGNGITWRVWNTVPISGAVINTGFERGWLTFESSGGTLRRLAPIPEGWEDVSPERLDLFCRAAVQVPRHTGPIRRVSFSDDRSADASDGN